MGKPSGEFRVIISDDYDDVPKASLNFASGSLVGVGCKLVQFVVYCVLFVMMSTNTEKNSAVSEEGHVLAANGFLLAVSLASIPIKSS